MADFAKRAARAYTGLVVLGWLACVACDGETRGPARPPLGRPNVLVLMAEDMSSRVGAFGDALASTPNIDALAERGVRFPNTFTTAGVCAPSRAAHITGRHQLSIGAQHMRALQGGGYLAVPPIEVKAYPELLRRAGYYTFTDQKLDYQFSGILSGSGPFTIWDEEGRGETWRGRSDEQPFYGLINFQATHESAVFPRGGAPRSLTHLFFQGLYAFEMRGQVPRTAPADVILPPYYPDTPPMRRDLARHYDNIEFMDAQVGEILARLEADGLAESTIVIWTTDHGDGLPRAKRELYDSGIRVPMIVYLPEAFRPDGWEPGGIDPQLVSFVDLAPTILGLGGVDPPAHGVGRRFVGGTDPARKLIYAAQDRVDDVEYRKRAVRDARFKYIRNDRVGEPGAQRIDFRNNLDSMRELWRLHARGELEGAARIWFDPHPEELLFDVDEDPHEIRDLSGDPAHAARLARMRSALNDWLSSLPAEASMRERDMAESFWPGGEQPVTAVPRIDAVPIDGDNEHIEVRLVGRGDGASLGYRLRGGEGDAAGQWRVYAGPFRAVKGQRIEARAVRYGWSESGVARQRF